MMKSILFKTLVISLCYFFASSLQSAAIKKRRLNLPIPIEIIEADDIGAAQKAIEQGYDVNTKYPEYTSIRTNAPICDAIDNTPLIIAIILNKLKMVQFLLSVGAYVNMRGFCNKTPLCHIIRYFYWYNDFRIDPKIFDLLLDHPSLDFKQLNEGETYLESALVQELDCEKTGEYFIVCKILNKMMSDMSKKDFIEQISGVLQEKVKYKCFPKLIKLFLVRGAMLKFEKNLFENESAFYGAKKINQEFIEDLIHELVQCVQEKADKRIEEILQSHPVLIDKQNQMGETVLLNAILFGRFDLIKKLFGDSIFIKPDLLIDQNENGKFGPNNPVQNAIDLRRRVYDTATLDQIIDYLKSKRLEQQILVEVKKSIKLPEEAIDLVTGYL